MRRLLLLIAAVVLCGAGPAEEGLDEALEIIEDGPRFEALALLHDAMGDELVPIPGEAGGEEGLEAPLRRVVQALLAEERGVHAARIDERWGASARALFRRWRGGDAAAGEALADRYALLDAGALALRLLASQDVEAGRHASALHRLRRYAEVRPERREAMAPRIEALLEVLQVETPNGGTDALALPEDPIVLWRRPLAIGAGSPVLPRAGLAADGPDVILHEDGVVRRMEAATGRIRWRFPAAETEDQDEKALRKYRDFDLPLRDVTVVRDLVLVVMGLPGGTGAWRDGERTGRLGALPREARMRLVALDKRSGALRWTTGRADDVSPVLGDPRCGAASPPFVVGEDVYGLFARRRGTAISYLAKLDLQTGKARWVTRLGSGESGRSRASQPGERRFARDAALALPWGARPHVAYKEVLAQPHLGFVAGVDPQTGRLRWRRQTPRSDASTAVGVERGFSARNEPLVRDGAWWLAPLDASRGLRLEVGTGRWRGDVPFRGRHVLAIGVQTHGIGRPWLESGRIIEPWDVFDGAPPNGDVHRAGPVYCIIGLGEMVAVTGEAAARAWAAPRVGDPVAAARRARRGGAEGGLVDAVVRAGGGGAAAGVDAVLVQADLALLSSAPEARLRRLDVLLTLPPERVRKTVRRLLRDVVLRASTEAVLSRLERWIESGDATWGRPLRRMLTGAYIAASEREVFRLRAERQREAGRPGLAAAACADLRLVARTGDDAARWALEEAGHLEAAGEWVQAADLLRDVMRWAKGVRRGAARQQLARLDTRTAWRPALPGPPRPLDLWTGDRSPRSDDEIRSIVVPHLVGPGAFLPRARIVVFRGLDAEVWNLEDGKRRARLRSDGAGWFGGSLQGVAPWLPEGGVLVTSLVAQEPADRAGFEIGDWILRWNGRALRGEAAFMAAVARSVPGQPIELEARRHGRPLVTTFVPGRRPVEQGAVVRREELFSDASGRLLVPDRMGLSWIDPASLERTRLWSWSGADGVVDRVRVLHGQAVVAIRRLGMQDAVVAVDLRHGTRQWRADVAGRIRSLHAAGSAVLVEAEDAAAFHLLDAGTGRLRLSRRILPPPRGPYRRVRTPRPAVVTTSGWVWYVDEEGDQLHALNSTTGEEVWSEPVVALNDALPLAAAGGLVAVVEMDELRVIEIESLTGRPRRTATWDGDVGMSEDSRVWLSADHVYLMQHGRRRRTARLRVIRVYDGAEDLELITRAAPFEGDIRWSLSYDHYVDAARLSPRGLFLVGSSTGGSRILRATAWLGSSGKRWIWTERAPRGILQTMRHPPGRFGRHAHWPTDRGLTLVPLAGSAATGRR